MRITAPAATTPRFRLGFAALLGVLAIWTTCELGFWQLRRAAAKEVLQGQVDAAAVASPQELDASSVAEPASLAHRHLALHGSWVPGHVVYLDNRPQGGRPGFYVLMGLHVARPVDAEVIVNRGWIPRDATERARIAPYRTPDGLVDVNGVALEDEPHLLELAAPDAPALGTIWQNFDFDAYAVASGKAPLAIVVRQDRGASPGQAADDGLSRDWPDRTGALQAQIDRHHGYAFQWFALAATLVALLLHQALRAYRHGRTPRQ